jgi:AraC-like DNA-binding protein
MERSGRLDLLIRDVRVLFRKRLHYDLDPPPHPSKCVQVQLQVGAVTLGYLWLPASQSPERNIAYEHWLQMACQLLAQELGSPHPHATDVVPAKIKLAARLIRERFSDPVSLAEIAEAVELSRERLSRLFHETLGITFSDYLNEVRLGEARQQLARQTNKITDIAYASGFQSLSQFNRRFRAAEGMSPSQYRKRHARSQTNMA